MLLYVGETSRLHLKHMQLHGTEAPGYFAIGFSLAFFIVFSASFILTLVLEQYAQAIPFLTSAKRGYTICKHFVHLDFQGGIAPGYLTKGLSEESSIISSAFFELTLFPLQ